MAGNQFKPIVEDDLSEVAAFLNVQQEITSREDPTQSRPSGDNLRWLLKNPHLNPGLTLGDTLRTSDGKILGMILAVPRLYRLGDRRLLGLAAGNFFVDASARMQGFFLLRRFLSTQQPTSGMRIPATASRGRCGPNACLMVPESDIEYLFPFRLRPLVHELGIRKQWPRALAGSCVLRGPWPPWWLRHGGPRTVSPWRIAT